MRTFHRLGAVSSLVLAGLSPSAQALDLPFARVASYNPTTPTTQGPATTLRVLERSYDGLDRLKTETVQLEDGTTAQLIYTHWRNGVRKTLTDAAGRVTFYEYDGRNRLERLTTNQGRADEQITTYDYWPDSLLKTVTKPDGTVTSYDYDRADRLTSVVVRKDGTEILSYAYTYDPNGNRQTQVETNGGPPETTTYGYDALDRLETVTYPDGRTVTYGYDAVGNRASETERDASSVVLSRKTAVFDAANRLSTVTDAVNPANNATFTFDPNGNLTAKTTAAGTETYAFDHRDQLVETAKDERVTARFAYDAFGRRYLKIGDEGLRQYLYDETSLLQEYSELSVEVAKYDWGGDRLVSLFRADEPRRYFHLDALGSIVALTDERGSVAARYHLDAWGNFRSQDERTHSANRFAFTGHIYDQETGLYNAKARYFDPKLGRFLTQDSYVGQIDEPPSLHRYLYANANPTRFIDLTGHAGSDAQARHFGKYRGKPITFSDISDAAAWTLGSMLRQGSDLAKSAIALLMLAQDEGAQNELGKNLFETAPVAVQAAMGDYVAQAELVGPVIESRLQAYERGIDEYAAAKSSFERGWSATGTANPEASFFAGLAAGIPGLARRGAAATVVIDTNATVNAVETATASQMARLNVGFRRVSYGMDDLSLKAVEFRKLNEMWGARNVAVVEYRVGDELRTLAAASERGTGHAEMVTLDALEAKGVNPGQITRVYSELEPCSGLPGGSCAISLHERVPQAEVTYSFQYGTTKASREAGRQDLMTAVTREKQVTPVQ